MISQTGTVYVSNLSKKLNVTQETIRKDLETLEKEGVLLRTHGGAVLNHKIPVHRQISNVDIKMSIAKAAAELVENGDIIALDSSDFSVQLAKELKDKSITVITNSISIMLELLDHENIQLITIGGYVNAQAYSFIGAVAEKSLDNYHVDKYFFSCSGFDLVQGVFEKHEGEAQIKKKFRSVADEVILMADHTQCNRKSLTFLMNIHEVSKLIIDSKLPLQQLTALKSIGINVVMSD
ncbi:DeoR/GlpR family DNA-binding transcription regulator [Paenibacillus sp. R14(2021)]|uniref:DeoR/GlpR family DNA-binding transcription regulator n=1 Tax=Paenibacillus sp. R14(2021) TaxID=2859228 RepID=UPI001C61401D|nr:DeoR/GlpR family DNA-binding transcription regulator [Paenibacillus sp. R14(2021)]